MITNLLLVRNEAYMQLLTVDISEEGIANDSGTLLTILLKDRTTNKNIVWASPSYEGMGRDFCADQPIKKNLIIGPYDSVIQPRIEKNKRSQAIRTRKRGEVFTPPWLIDKQVSIVIDELGDISFETFINLRWLELACGEAPYIATRYDSITGEIIPVEKRVGFLDRKLQRIAKKTTTEQEFIKWSKLAYESSYGYELQGDSLLLARENLLLSFYEHFEHKFGKIPTMKVVKQIATIISYNIFQMNGLTKQTPYSDYSMGNIQLNLFEEIDKQEKQGDVFTLIKDWRNKVLVSMDSISKGDEMMKFDVVIGNPPYQEEIDGDNPQSKPIYNLFMDEAYKIGEKSCLITPARFLVEAGATPKKWNKAMLNSEHLKVLYYAVKSQEVFSGDIDIKGGVVITYYDHSKIFEPIHKFIPIKELASLYKKVSRFGESTLDTIMFGSTEYKLTEKVFIDYPELLTRTDDAHRYAVSSNIYPRYPEIFSDEKVNNYKSVGILGREANKRVIKYTKREYIKPHPNLDAFKVLVPAANGSGAIGEVLSTPLIGEPLIGEPLIGYTQTFISFGCFDNKYEANSLLKYIKTKFARALLGILKITQNNQSKAVWKFIPLQDFTVDSDIDWSQSISDIDRQLYAKYRLSQDEIDFIESKVRAMD